MTSIKYDQAVEKEISFPILGIYKECNLVVLFTSKSKGTVVYSEKNINGSIGYYSDGWSIDWIPYTGQIKLSN